MSIATQVCFTQKSMTAAEAKTANANEKYLHTGFYGISSVQTDYARAEANKADSVFIIPEPLITIRDFKSLHVRPADANQPAFLVFQFDESVHEKWLNATTEYRGSQIGFILDNKLIQVVTVHEPLYEGYAHISGGLTEEELAQIKNRIQKSLNAARK